MRHNKSRLILLIPAILLICVLALPVTAGATGSYWTDGVTLGGGFSGGDGTEGNPYLISTPQDLAQLCVNVNDPTDGRSYEGDHFKLTADLDLAGKDWTPIGSGERNAAENRIVFSGSFDGQGHIINHVTVNMPADQYLGLFGYATGALIKNLGVENCAISGAGAAGGLAGRADNDTSIHNCHTSGTVSVQYNESVPEGEYNGVVAGGLVGNYGNAFSTIDGCYSTANVSGQRCIGGLVGYCGSAHIKNSYATGTVTATSTGGGLEAGGFVGLAYGSIFEKCYATGNVNGAYTVGGFVGDISTYNGDPSSVTNCYAWGNVTFNGTETGNTFGSFVGVLTNISFSNCYGFGSVSAPAGSDHIGGFFGNINQDSTLHSFTACFCIQTITKLQTLGKGPVGITGLSAADMLGTDTLTSTTKMDILDSGSGAPVSGVPIWYAHTSTPPTFTGEHFTVTFDSQGATTAASPASKSVTDGGHADALPTVPVKTGYTFGGWWTQINGGGSEFTAATTVTADITVYAKWTKDSSVSIYVGGRKALAPATAGGTWNFDNTYLTLTQNTDGTVTVKGVKVGTTVVTYTANGAIEHFTVTITQSDLPSTGQDSTWIYLFTGLGVIVLAAALLTGRKKAKAQRS